MSSSTKKKYASSENTKPVSPISPSITLYSNLENTKRSSASNLNENTVSEVDMEKIYQTFDNFIYLTDDELEEKINNSWFYNFFVSKLKKYNIRRYNVEKEKGLNFYNKNFRIGDLYKKSIYKNDIYYIDINDYCKTMTEIKIKQIIHICELLGVKEIQISDSENTNKSLSVEQKSEILERGEKIAFDINNIIDEKKSIKIQYNNRLLKNVNLKYENFITEITTNYKNYFINKDILEEDSSLKNLIYSRLENNLNTFDLDYKISTLDSQDYKIALKFKSEFNLSIGKRHTYDKTINLKIIFFDLRDLINSQNMYINERCFQVIMSIPSQPLITDLSSYTSTTSIDTPRESFSHSSKDNLLDNFLEKYIDIKVPDELFKYKLLKIVDKKLYQQLISNIKTYHDLHVEDGTFFETFRSISLSNILTFDDTGYGKINNIYNFICKYPKKPTSHPSDCSSFKCRVQDCPMNLNRIIFTWIIRVYNKSNEKILTFDKIDDNFYINKIKIIYQNIKCIPDYEKFSKFVCMIINKE